MNCSQKTKNKINLNLQLFKISNNQLIKIFEIISNVYNNNTNKKKLKILLTLLIDLYIYLYFKNFPILIILLILYKIYFIIYNYYTNNKLILLNLIYINDKQFYL